MTLDITTAWIVLAALVGLCIGSFTNVVIYRLPLMLERQWEEEYREFQQQGDAVLDGQDAPAEAAVAGTEAALPAGEEGRPAEAAPYNLMEPGSSCPHCGHRLAWYELFPVLSWIALRGRCSSCKAAISARYPLVEAAVAALWAWAVWQWGPDIKALAWAGFGTTLLALALIDWDTTLLPDVMTLPLLWAGLVAAALGWSGLDLNTAFWGAVSGYLVLWVTYQAFRLVTGREGMGFGDFKLLAALGAWFGWMALPTLLLLASVSGLAGGLLMRLKGGLREGGYFPFGPFLVLAGFVQLVAGPIDLRALFGL